MCSQCREYQPYEGSRWLVYNNGRNRRWVCKGCVERMIKRGELSSEDTTN